MQNETKRTDIIAVGLRIVISIPNNQTNQTYIGNNTLNISSRHFSKLIDIAKKVSKKNLKRQNGYLEPVS